MTPDETSIIKPKVKIKVFGVGGGGNSVLMRMGQHNELEIELIAINTDAKQLQLVEQSGVRCIQIGESLTRGRGTGGNIAVAEQALFVRDQRGRSDIHNGWYGRRYRNRCCSCGGASGQGARYIVCRRRDGAVLF